MSHTIRSSTHVPMAAEVLSWLFYKNTFSSCAAKAKESEGVEWRTRVGVVINTGQGRVRVGKWLHARGGNTGERNTRDARNTTLASRCLSLPLVSK